MGNKPPKVAYLVVCWNNREIIDKCLESLFNQTYHSKDIYVIDNASSDGSADYIEEKYPDVKLTKSDTNNGFSIGNNVLIKEALKDKEVSFVALINSDATLDAKWTSEIVEFLKDKPRVAGVQGITLDYYNHAVIDAEHVYMATNFQSIQYGYGENFKKSHAYPRKVFGVNAAAAVYSRKFIEQQYNQKLFDEKFYMYLEDVDVSFRALMTGWSNYAIPSARAYHMGSVSSKKRSNGYNIQMTFRNQAALLFKNMPFKVFIAHIPEALRFEMHFYKHLYRTHGLSVAWRASKGRLVGIARLPLYIPDRWRLRKQRKITNASLDKYMRNKGIA